jgi:DnaK suppressor protein
MAKQSILNKADQEEILAKLETEKASLENELQKFSKKNPNNPDEYLTQIEDLGSDEDDSVAEVEQYSLELSLEETLAKSLRDVNKAIDSVKKGTYGLCKYCKQPIDVARLKARPTSTSCVTCKTKLKSL